MQEDYFFIDNNQKENKVHILIIYDIADDKRRNKLVTFLMGYGFRIQKSAFEAVLRAKLYRKMLSEIGRYATEEDNIRVYRIMDEAHILNFGKEVNSAVEEIIII